MNSISNLEGNRNNPYTFDDFLFVRNHFDYYKDDPFFPILVEKFIPKDEWDKINRDLNALSE